MSLTTCLYCKKMINHISGPVLCSDCDEKLFQNIKEYLNEHPNSKIDEVSKETKIPIKIISSYIKDGRLEELNSKTYFCSLCGNVIDDNVKYCGKCMKRIKTVNELSNLANALNNDIRTNSSGMHYFKDERIRKR